MNKILITAFFILFMAGRQFVHADALSIHSVHEDAGEYELVLLEGDLIEKLTFDHFVLKDTSGEMVLNFEIVKNDVEVDDRVLIYGRYEREDNFPEYKGEVLVYKVVMASDKKQAKKVTEEYKKNHKKKEPLLKLKGKKNVTQRLEELESLKKKNLISADEYKTIRQRILNEL